jgi:hypothetical protein
MPPALPELHDPRQLAAGAERPRSDRGGPGATGSRVPEPIPDALRRQQPGKSPGTGRSRRTPVHWPRSIWSSPIPRSLRCSIEFGNGTLRRISPQGGQPEFRAEIGAGRSTAQAVRRESERNPPARHAGSGEERSEFVKFTPVLTPAWPLANLTEGRIPFWNFQEPRFWIA